MKKIYINNYFKFYLALYLTLIIGFILNENSTGGAIIDYLNQKKAVKDFSNDFLTTLLNYDEYSTRHSPIFIIILSFFEKTPLTDLIIRFFHLHISLTLPFIFFLILKEKFKFKYGNFYHLLVGLIFLSPTFRTLSIWPDSRLIGLIFFSLSILFYLKFNNTKKRKYCFLNILFCSIASYLSPNFAVFSIFYFYKFYMYFNRELIILSKIIFVNILLSIPAIYYIFILNINFLNQPAAVRLNNDGGIFFNNISNNILLISSIILFYLIPFLKTKIISMVKLNIYNYYFLFIIIILFLICINFFNYQFYYTGGGIFYKFSYFFFKNNYLFYIISLFSLIILLKTTDGRLSNFILLICLILNNPQITVYHKYYDPFLLIMFFSLFNFNYNFNNISKSDQIIIYSYFLIFLLLSNIKLIWTI